MGNIMSPVLAESGIHQCQNCGKIWKVEELAEIENLDQRITAGETVPSGQCPDEDCGALCRPYNKPKGKKAKKGQPKGNIYEVEVHGDGDIEIVRHDIRPKLSNNLIFDGEEALRKELESYGVDKERIDAALEDLETHRDTTV